MMLPSPDPQFELDEKADNKGVVITVKVKENGVARLLERRFKGWTRKEAMLKVEAFIEEEKAKLDRAEWGKKRRRAGRKRQAALKSAMKAQRP